MERSLRAHFQRHTCQAPAGTMAAAPVAHSSQNSDAASSVPQTFLLSHFTSRACSVTSSSSAFHSMSRSRHTHSASAWRHSQPVVPHQGLQPVAEEPSSQLVSEGLVPDPQPLSPPSSGFDDASMPNSLPLRMPGMRSCRLPWPSDLGPLGAPGLRETDGAQFDVCSTGGTPDIWSQHSAQLGAGSLQVGTELAQADFAPSAMSVIGEHGCTAASVASMPSIVEAPSKLPFASNASSIQASSAEGIHSKAAIDCCSWRWGGILSAGMTKPHRPALARSEQSLAHTGELPCLVCWSVCIELLLGSVVARKSQSVYSISRRCALRVQEVLHSHLCQADRVCGKGGYLKWQARKFGWTL